MKKKVGIFLLIAILIVLMSAYVSQASVPDADQDGVPDAQDKCLNSASTVVDQFGCACSQKTANNCASLYQGAQCCVSDNNPCTDDCAANNVGIATCSYPNNNNACPNGVCRNRQCIPNELNNPPIGWLDIANCEFIRGWALDEDAKDVSVKVHLYKDGGANVDPKIGGIFVQEILTNIFRVDVNDYYGATGNHGFMAPTPASLKDGVSHPLYVHGIDSTQNPSMSSLLLGVPKPIRCTNNQALISGTTFTASKSTIQSGEEVTLSWTTSNANPIKILDHMNNLVPNVQEASGSVKVNPQYSTTYILTASYESGDVSKSLTVNVGAGTTDRTPPVRTNGQPTSLPEGTISTTISLTTNEDAVCKYSATADLQYSAMSDQFSTTGGTSHSKIISGLTSGNVYTYYVKCRDSAGNSNPDDYAISFSAGIRTCASQGKFTCAEGKMCPGTSVPASDTIRCCSVECATPSWNSCSQCGTGLFNLCDRQECNSITQNCYFAPKIIGGDCYGCTGKRCEDYTKQEICIENHCGFSGCAWSGNSCITQNTPLTIEQQANLIGNMYNCPEGKPNIYNVLGNIGYSFSDDELIYAYARLLNEKGCHKGSEKYVIFYVSTVNFPVNGRAEGQGSDAEQKWLEYWNKQTQRFSDLGYKIIIHPMYFIINDNSPNLDYASGLRPLVKLDLNLEPNQVPVVFRCKTNDDCIKNYGTPNQRVARGAECYTPIASVYDPKTFDLAVKFYGGIKDVFSQYPAFVKISITAPSDFGEYGFPFGIEGRWWNGGAYLGQTASSGGCYAIGDSSVPSSITTQNFRQPLDNYMQRLVVRVREIFSDNPKRYMVFMGYGNDVNPRDGFSYRNVVQWAQPNGIELHSTHAIGVDWVDEIIGADGSRADGALKKIASAKTSNAELTFENDFPLNENIMSKILYHSSKYGVTGFQPNTGHAYDNFYLNHLMYSMGPSAKPDKYPSKGMIFSPQTNGLASLRSTHLTNGEMTSPANDATINDDIIYEINGWGFFDAPYTDKDSYGVKIYAGHLMDNPAGAGVSMAKHPEYMRLVGSTVTQYERQNGMGDKSGFKYNWKPNLASGKAILRIYLLNGDSQIIAEHPKSPIIVNIQSRITGSATFTRTGYSYPGNMCARSFTMSGTVTDSQRQSQNLNIVIVDEYRGRILAQGTTTGNSFTINFNVPSTPGEETQVITPRAYVNTGTDLIALQTNIVANGLDENPIINKFGNSVVKC